MNLLLIAIGGALGTLLRYATFETSAKLLPLNFPYATLLVNIIGSLIIGFSIIYISDNFHLAQSIRSFVIVGFCGGLTTFSAFSLDNAHLLQTEHPIVFLLNILANVVLCLLRVFVGMYIASKI